MTAFNLPFLPNALSQQARRIPLEMAGWNVDEKLNVTPPFSLVDSAEVTSPRPFLDKCLRAT